MFILRVEQLLMVRSAPRLGQAMVHASKYFTIHYLFQYFNISLICMQTEVHITLMSGQDRVGAQIQQKHQKINSKKKVNIHSLTIVVPINHDSKVEGSH